MLAWGRGTCTVEGFGLRVYIVEFFLKVAMGVKVLLCRQDHEQEDLGNPHPQKTVPAIAT